MPEVVSPTAAEVRQWTGVTRYLTGDSDVDFDALIERLTEDAAGETALVIGEATFDAGAFTARQARALGQAVAYRTAVALLTYCLTQDATGTAQPLLMADADTISAVIEYMLGRGRELESLVVNGIAVQPEKAFALPTASSSTFTVTATDRTPAARNELLDERDNVSAEDAANG